MISFLTKAKMTVAAAPFLGAVSLGVAYGDGQTFEAAGLANGNQFVYVAFDGTQMEQGQGVYTDLAHGGPSFTRAQITLSTNANNPVSLGPSTFVYATAVTDGSLDPYTTDLLRGNLAFDPTVQGLRVTGDLSNVVAGYRFGFQTATTNGDTHVEAFPNGSSRTAAFNAESDPQRPEIPAPSLRRRNLLLIRWRHKRCFARSSIMATPIGCRRCRQPRRRQSGYGGITAAWRRSRNKGQICALVY
jgi:hypothetical protein